MSTPQNSNGRLTNIIIGITQFSCMIFISEMLNENDGTNGTAESMSNLRIETGI